MKQFRTLGIAVCLANQCTTDAVAPMPTGNWPKSQGNVKYPAPKVIPAKTVFDGGMKTYERSDISCNENQEGGKSGALFILKAGATLQNVIVGPRQQDGVHCEEHDCTIKNVWWADVCEDALSIIGGSANSVSNVIGGGAKLANDKIIQHNGPGTVNIEGFYAEDFGKLYRSCGKCKTQYPRAVKLTNIYAVDPKVTVVAVNSNYNDKATLTNVKIDKASKNKPVCEYTKGSTSAEPSVLGKGPSGSVCNYKTSTVTYV